MSGCENKPCLNGGTCTQAGGEDIVCSCPPNFGGALCQTSEGQYSTVVLLIYSGNVLSRGCYAKLLQPLVEVCRKQGVNSLSHF